jgi:hypothetical protein
MEIRLALSRVEMPPRAAPPQRAGLRQARSVPPFGPTESLSQARFVILTPAVIEALPLRMVLVRLIGCLDRQERPNRCRI